MREATPLTQTKPPLAAPVFIPGCSTATPAFDCPLDRFETLVSQALAS
jgi:4-phytase/acid phosphatase